MLDHAKDFDLVLISLGPTATVLSYDISKHGIRCIDTGHIDIEYEWMCSSAQNKVAVNRKTLTKLVSYLVMKIKKLMMITSVKLLCI